MEGIEVTKLIGIFSKEALAIAFDYVRNNPKWRLSMQTHKWLGVL